MCIRDRFKVKMDNGSEYRAKIQINQHNDGTKHYYLLVFVNKI